MQEREYRQAIREMADRLSRSDEEWYVCRRTGLSYVDLTATAAECGGDMGCFCRRLGYKNLRRRNKYDDNGWWTTLCSWLRMYIPQWEARFMKAMSDLDPTTHDLVELPDPQQIIETAAKALNISADLLLHFSQNRALIEVFLKTQRTTLGTMAEARLWELVAQGDAPTIRWLLPRLNPEVYGDKLVTGDKDSPKTITIIER